MIARRNTTFPTPRRRRGASILEVVVMLTVSSMMLGLAVVTIHLLLRAERHSTQAIWQRATLARLSRTLRDDVHAAVEANIKRADDDRSPGLRLRLSDNAHVTYEIDDHILTRIRTSDDRQTAREVFYLPIGSTLRFETDEQPTSIVRLIVHRTGPPVAAAVADKPKSSNAGRTLIIEAVSGRDRHYGGTRPPDR